MTDSNAGIEAVATMLEASALSTPAPQVEREAIARAVAKGCLAAALADHVVGWRTMDSAPKDGTRLLVARFHPGKESIIEVDRWKRPEDRAGYTGFGRFNMTYWPPTHWMPLPAQPAKEG